MEKIHHLENQIEQFDQDRSQYINKCSNQLKKMEKKMIEIKNQTTNSNKKKNEMKKQLDDIQIKNNQLLFEIQKATDTADRMEGERNSNKQKAKALKQDMSKIFRACGGKSIDDVEALVRERRELQVHVKIHQAERDGEKFLSLLCPIVFSPF